MHQAAVLGSKLIDEIPDIPEGEPFAQEWRTFKREVYRLVSEHQKGHFALIKGDQFVSIWDTRNDAEQAGRLLFGSEPFMIQEI